MVHISHSLAWCYCMHDVIYNQITSIDNPVMISYWEWNSPTLLIMADTDMRCNIKAQEPF